MKLDVQQDLKEELRRSEGSLSSLRRAGRKSSYPAASVSKGKETDYCFDLNAESVTAHQT